MYIHINCQIYICTFEAKTQPQLGFSAMFNSFQMKFRFCICLLGSTARHALEHGFRTVLIEDACRGVAQSDIDRTKEELRALGAIIVDSSEVSYGCFTKNRVIVLPISYPASIVNLTFL